MCCYQFHLEPTIGNFHAISTTPNSVNLQWSQLESDVAVFSLTHFIGNPTDAQYTHFRIAPKNGSLPLTYTQRVTALSGCSHYTFILKSHGKEGCGIPEVKVLSIVTKSLSE